MTIREKVPTLGLFEGFGIEIELMVVDQNSFNVKPIVDELFKSVAGEYVSDVDDGPITWSNELVSHVVELKTNGPADNLNVLHDTFHKSVVKINGILGNWGACLLGTAMHPWMNPHQETKLWAHDNNEVYHIYDQIFGCKGHGWSNLQSVHINLPFKNDSEFGRLHSAIRVLLPLIPALTASSPLMDGLISGSMDTRLVQYQLNQKQIPSIAGLVIPEPVIDKASYEKEILAPIYREITPFDPSEILREDWLNSRGAIARWERQTIEIRVIDSQECPRADLSYAILITEVLRLLVSEKILSYEKQRTTPTQQLKDILDHTIANGERAAVRDKNYTSLLGWNSSEIPTAGDLWALLLEKLLDDPNQRSPAFALALPDIKTLLKLGPLARRIVHSLPSQPKQVDQLKTYRKLARCLAENLFFIE